MNFIIGGGVHEHGRNCFYIRSNVNYIVDCGVMRGSDDPYPHLNEQQIKSTEYLFLTHSHEDHIGAFGWLIRNGFNGTVVASDETLSALPYYEKKIALPLIERRLKLDRIEVNYGRSGHCVGSLWFDIHTVESSVLFSGDYCENSCYTVDTIVGKTSELAVLDCAFGYANYKRAVQEQLIFDFVIQNLSVGPILFPVPKNGRAVDIISLLEKIDCNVSVDAKLRDFLSEQFYNDFWIDKKITDEIKKKIYRDYDPKLPCVYFIADAQLSSKEGVTTAQSVLCRGGRILLTGHTDAGSEAENLLKNNSATSIPYNAHCCFNDVKTIASRNKFGRIILYHSKQV